jgi:hypothetical protein
MAKPLRIIGALLAPAGVVVLLPAAFLANQEVGFVPLPWLVTGITLNGVPISNAAAASVLGMAGCLLLVTGLFLILRPSWRAT